MVNTMLSMFYVFRWIPQDVLLPHLQATTCRTRAGNLLQTTLHNARWGSQYEHNS